MEEKKNKSIYSMYSFSPICFLATACTGGEDDELWRWSDERDSCRKEEITRCRSTCITKSLTEVWLHIDFNWYPSSSLEPIHFHNSMNSLRTHISENSETKSYNPKRHKCIITDDHLLTHCRLQKSNCTEPAGFWKRFIFRLRDIDTFWQPIL